MFVETEVEPTLIIQKEERPYQADLHLVWFILRLMAVLGAIKIAYLFAAWAGVGV